MIESYLELIGATTRAAQEHELLIAVQIDARHAADQGPGRTRGLEAGVGGLLEQTERVAQGIEAAEVTVLGALSAGQLARALRTAFDPYARAELAAIEATDPGRVGLAESGAWPLGARRALGALPGRRSTARNVLDRAVAAGRRLADVHGRPARRLERSAHGGGDARADHTGALNARGRGRRHPRPRRPRACATASDRPRRRGSGRSRRRPCAARPSSPPAMPRCGWRAS